MKKLLTLLFVGTAIAGVSYADVVLVNETFSDGNRTTQNSPNSLAWFSSAGTANLSVSNGMMVNNTPGTTRGGVGYFESTTITVGETIVLSFDLTPFNATSGGYAGGFVIGLFDSFGLSGNIQTADGSQPAANTSQGYSSNLGFTSSAGGYQYVQLQERSGSGTLLANTTLTQIARGANNRNYLTSGVAYDYEFSIERISETAAEITLLISGGDLAGALTLSQTSDLGVFTFDTIGFTNADGATAGFDQVGLSNISVSVVPEPAAAAAALMLAALSLAVVRIRRG